jgi:hypothetical protein
MLGGDGEFFTPMTVRAGDMAVPGNNDNAETHGSSLILSHLSNVVERISRRRPGESRDGDNMLSESRASTTLNLTVYDRLLGGAVTLGASLALIQLSMYLVNRAYILLKRQKRNRDRSEGRRKRIKKRLGKENMNIQYNTPEADDCRYSWYHYVLPVFLAELLIGNRNDFDNIEDEFDYNDEGSDCLTFDSDFEKPDSSFAAQASRAITSTNEVSHPQCPDHISLQVLSGSCHCQSVQFILRRPPMHIAEAGKDTRPLIQAHDSPGKIRYPKVPLSTASSQFELAPTSVRYLKTYHGVSSTTDSTAHAFCSVCGVHILYAPDSKLDFIEVNGHCLDLSGATVNGARAPELHVLWRPINDPSAAERQEEMEWKQRPKSDSVSTHMTEATTVTLSSGFHEQQIARSSDRMTSGMEIGPGRPLFQTPNSAGSIGFRTGSFYEVDSCVTTPAPGAEAIWRESQHGSASYFPPSAESHNNSSPTNSIKSDMQSGFSRSSSFTAYSGSRRNKKLGIDSPAKQNLMHYMRRHLTSPKEADEESPVKGNS